MIKQPILLPALALLAVAPLARAQFLPPRIDPWPYSDPAPTTFQAIACGDFHGRLRGSVFLVRGQRLYLAYDPTNYAMVSQFDQASHPAPQAENVTGIVAFQRRDPPTPVLGPDFSTDPLIAEPDILLVANSTGLSLCSYDNSSQLFNFSTSTDLNANN
jgi:hypothetical protein